MSIRTVKQHSDISLVVVILYLCLQLSVLYVDVDILSLYIYFQLIFLYYYVPGFALVNLNN